MARQLLHLIPLIIGSAVVPLQVMMIILLLDSPRQRLFKAICLVAGMTTVRLLQGCCFWADFIPWNQAYRWKKPCCVDTAPCFRYSPAHHGIQAMA